MARVGISERSLDLTVPTNMWTRDDFVTALIPEVSCPECLNLRDTVNEKVDHPSSCLFESALSSPCLYLS